GSVPVGKRLAELAGRHMKPAIMELGGHAPAVVCDDVDPEAAAAASVLAKSRNAGQVCVAPTRFFVQDRIYDRFVAAAGERAAALKIGDGLDPATQMGPLANPRRVEAMEALVADAAARGARVAAGGARVGNRGYYFPLTVLADMPDDARAMREEPFGLAAYALTESADNVAALSDGLECGNLAINHFVASVAETPFGGVKDSGYGREGGTEGLEEYTTVKLVSHLTKVRSADVDRAARPMD
ncbi:MAG: aldehyde dehydrogenase family protein, partial [Acetobacteraceae bacterium]|nr:aldehyde dehydrogenase family protein [Acetobacteraceae bacterium]